MKALVIAAVFVLMVLVFAVLIIRYAAEWIGAL
jgi:hypothetical protein